MLKHSDVWRAIDRLAAKHGLSPSGLARRSGLDPTTFNKSKRVAREGRQRWPCFIASAPLAMRQHRGGARA